MNQQDIDKALYNKYIAPTERKRKRHVGIEIEMPIVNLAKKPVEEKEVLKMAEAFREKFGFEPIGRDDNGFINSMADKITGDDLSFDCSYSNLELSLGKGENLFEIKERFDKYYQFINCKLNESRYTLTGMGINPYYHINHNNPIPNERYRMLYHYLHTYDRYDNCEKRFHGFPQFGTFTSASQVQLDVDRENLIDTINVFGKLEPYKSLLFANSYFDEEPRLLCARNMLWERSMQGYNSHNIGMFDCELKSVDELLEYIKSTSIYCVMRNGKYVDFTPIPINDFLKAESITGEYFDSAEYRTTQFVPEISDLEYLRTFKFEDLTYRGTIEFRSMCCQPIEDVMTVSAFHLGLMGNLQGLKDLLENDNIVYSHGYTSVELQRMFSERVLPEFIESKNLAGQLVRILDICADSLKKRGGGEEIFLEPLYKRAKNLTNPAKDMIEGLEKGTPIEYYINKYAEQR